MKNSKNVRTVAHRGIGVTEKPRSAFLNKEEITSTLSNYFADEHATTLDQESISKLEAISTNFFPENSMAAFKEAIKQGARVLECDIQNSKNNTAMVIHGSTILDYSVNLFDIGLKKNDRNDDLKSANVYDFTDEELQQKFALINFDLLQNMYRDNSETLKSKKEAYEELSKRQDLKELLKNNPDFYQIPTLKQLLEFTVSENKKLHDKDPNQPLISLNIELKGRHSAYSSLLALLKLYNDNPEAKKYLPPSSIIFLGQYRVKEIAFIRNILNGDFSKTKLTEDLAGYESIERYEKILFFDSIKKELEENGVADLVEPKLLETKDNKETRDKIFNLLKQYCKTDNHFKTFYEEFYFSIKTYDEQKEKYSKNKSVNKPKTFEESLLNSLRKTFISSFTNKANDRYIPAWFLVSIIWELNYLNKLKNSYLVNTLAEYKLLNGIYLEILSLVNKMETLDSDSDSDFSKKDTIVKGVCNGKSMRAFKDVLNSKGVVSDEDINKFYLRFIKFINKKKPLPSEPTDNVKNSIISGVEDSETKKAIISELSDEELSNIFGHISSELKGCVTNVMISTGELYGERSIYQGNDDFELKIGADFLTASAKKLLEHVIKQGHNGIDISLFDVKENLLDCLKELYEKYNNVIPFLGFTASNWKGSKKENSLIDLGDTAHQALKIFNSFADKIDIIVKIDEPGIFDLYLEKLKQLKKLEKLDLTFYPILTKTPRNDKKTNPPILLQWNTNPEYASQITKQSSVRRGCTSQSTNSSPNASHNYQNFTPLLTVFSRNGDSPNAQNPDESQNDERSRNSSFRMENVNLCNSSFFEKHNSSNKENPSKDDDASLKKVTVVEKSEFVQNRIRNKN